MKKRTIVILVAVLLAVALIVTLVLLGNKGTPNGDEDFDDARKKLEEGEGSTNKKDIEKNIKEVFGVELSLPDGDEYVAETVEISGSSSYAVLVYGSSMNAEQYYNSVKSKFSKWTAIDEAKTFSYVTDDVTYGAVFEDEEDDLCIAFSMTDNEMLEGLEDLIGDTSSFRNEIKTLSGVEFTFPDFVTSVALENSSSVGSKVEYSAMLLSGGANLTKTQFEAIIDAITPQLTGYTKGEAVEGSNSTKVQWVNDENPTRYFEIVLNDYDGSTWVNFGYGYADRSLLVPWPEDEIDAFLGEASAIPAYSGDYRDLETSYSADWAPNEFTVELNGADEDEFNAWIAYLADAGFVAQEIMDEYYGTTYTQYARMINEGLYLTLIPEFFTYGSVYIELIKEVYENTDWPTQALIDAYGEKAAVSIPQLDKAAKRCFVFDPDSDEITVQNNVSMELYDEYAQKLLDAGFELTYSNSYSTYVTYTKIFDNWDELKISIEYVDDSYYDETNFYIDISFKPYTGFSAKLPENVEIVYQTTMVIGESSATYEDRIVKLGESYYVTGSYYDMYYEFNSTDRTWTAYEGAKGDDGTEWSVYEENLSRSGVDNKLKGAFTSMNSNAKKAEPEQNSVYAGVNCVKYIYEISYGQAYNYSYEYWIEESTGLVFRYYSSYEGGSTETLITDYDTSVNSFEGLELPQ